MIVALLLIVGAGAIFFLYTQPTFDSLQTARAQSDEYDQALAKAAELQQLKQTLLSRYNAFNPADLSRLQTMLPDSVDNIRLILNLDNMAEADGMALQNVVVNAPVTTPQGAIGAVSQGGSKYDSLTLSFSTHGTYMQFKQFLNDLQRSLRIVDLVSLDIQPDATAASPTSAGSQPEKPTDPSFGYDITVRTYWLR
jgi:Tfp pilus assembly protein PilO